jgi:hypothetical protein
MNPQIRSVAGHLSEGRSIFTDRSRIADARAVLWPLDPSGWIASYRVTVID